MFYNCLNFVLKFLKKIFFILTNFDEKIDVYFWWKSFEKCFPVKVDETDAIFVKYFVNIKKKIIYKKFRFKFPNSWLKILEKNLIKIIFIG